jgi:hypothetical protein
VSKWRLLAKGFSFWLLLLRLFQEEQRSIYTKKKAILCSLVQKEGGRPPRAAQEEKQREHQLRNHFEQAAAQPRYDGSRIWRSNNTVFDGTAKCEDLLAACAFSDVALSILVCFRTYQHVLQEDDDDDDDPSRSKKAKKR